VAAAVAEAGGFLAGEGPEKPFVQDVWRRFLAPLVYRTQDLARRGLPQAEQARQVLDSVQPLAHKINHVILDSISKRFGNFESVRLDTTHDFFKFISEDGTED
jgi:hypothetical protein